MNKETNKKKNKGDTCTKEKKRRKNKITTSDTYTKNIVYTEVLTK